MDLKSGYGYGLALYINRGLVKTVESAKGRRISLMLGCFRPSAGTWRVWLSDKSREMHVTLCEQRVVARRSAVLCLARGSRKSGRGWDYSWNGGNAKDAAVSLGEV
jgi:hypothetical protein